MIGWDPAAKAANFAVFLEHESLAQEWWDVLPASVDKTKWDDIKVACTTRWPVRVATTTTMAQRVERIKAERITEEEVGQTERVGRTWVGCHILW